jgi:hypothetical protein
MTINTEKINLVMGTLYQQRLLIHLLNVGEGFPLGISQATGISYSNFGRLVNPLIAAGVITEKPVGKRVRLYIINEESPVTKELRRSFENLSQIVE